MSEPSLILSEELATSSSLADLLLSIPPRRRGAALHAALTGACNEADLAQYVTSLRVGFDNYWAQLRSCRVPAEKITKVLEPPVPIKTVMAFSRLMFARSVINALKLGAESRIHDSQLKPLKAAMPV